MTAATVATACLSFPVSTRIAWVKPGQTRTQVRWLVGEPESISDEVALWPFTYPADIIGVRSSYEQWVYRDGNTIYAIHFGGKCKEPRDQWTVIGMQEFPPGTGVM